MKKYLILLLVVCLTLVGCTAKDNVSKGKFDRKGFITEVDVTGNRVLVDDLDNGLIWLTLPSFDDITKYDVNQEVVVWIGDGVKESYPAQATARNIEILQSKKLASDSFDYSNHAFPPHLAGVIEINGTSYKMEKGGFRWTKGNQTITTDAASPTQIAEKLEPITIKANSEAIVVIEQNPSLSVYIWDTEQRTTASVKGGQITLPATSGNVIYEVVANWANGEVSFTFVVDITE
ncbi:DUF3221 domain-containing protein [Sporosarcina beigongshangi]|uniref:DUF3221 domain-containing protein n=1 Tax=Sporosarcina beigongshangi TaxID=2782538 RepID=UPI001939C2B8|nr:DUF3221 domain-containing protein [Sporosarcina beigongshangi]